MRPNCRQIEQHGFEPLDNDPVKTRLSRVIGFHGEIRKSACLFFQHQIDLVPYPTGIIALRTIEINGLLTQ